MPNRIIKESAFTSDKVAQLTDFEFRLWVGLITQADDAGRGDARPAIIKGRIFALRDRTTQKDIDNALNALAAHGCITLYKVNGKPYYEFPHWTAHQRVRNALPKYPGSDEKDPENDDLQQSAASCGELPPVAASRGEARPKSNPIQSNTNPNPIHREGTRFAPPTLEEVTAYCRERNSPVDPRKFWEYFNAGGWKDSKGNPVRSWKQKLLTWEKYDEPKTSYPQEPAKTEAENDDDMKNLLAKLKEAE